MGIELYSQSSQSLSTNAGTLDLTASFEECYQNAMQIKANLIDSNVLIVEAGRATGKTEGVMGPRFVSGCFWKYPIGTGPNK